MTLRGAFQLLLAVATLSLLFLQEPLAARIGEIPLFIGWCMLILMFASEVKYALRSRLSPEQKLDEKNG